MYKQILEKRNQIKQNQVAIRSHGHQMGVCEQNKITGSPLGAKKWIAYDGVTTRSYGHYLILWQARNEMYDAITAFIEKLFGN